MVDSGTGRENPYAAPEAVITGGSSTSSDAERIRQEHIKHETSVKSIGCLYYLGGVGVFLAAISMVAASLTGGGGEAGASTLGATGFLIPMALVYFSLGVLQVVVARAIRRLKAWVKVPVGILSGLGLLAVPVGTLVNLYILWLVFSEKGQTVLSPQYQEIVRQTPHVKYKHSTLVLVLAGVFVLLAIIAIAIAVKDL